MFTSLIALLMSLYAHFPVYAQDYACDFPRTNRYYSQVETTGIRKSSFLSAIALARKHYEAEFENLGCSLIIHESWEDGTVNAQAWREFGECHVEMFGGFARYPGMTKNGFIAVLCHEIGHHLGGQPRYNRGSDWASVEGQADYYATLTCMKKLGIPSMAASLVLAKTLADLNGERDPSRATRDTSRVTRTYESHPRAQCRLDTYDAGRLRQSRPRCWYAP